MLKKAKLYSLLAIIVASTAVGLFGPSQTAFADEYDATGFDDQRVLDDANVITYSYVMSECLNYTSKDNSVNDRARDGDNSPKRKNLISGDWFTNTQISNSDKGSPQFEVGFSTANNGGDGIISCQDSSFNMGRYFTSLGGWGTGNELAAACDISFRLNDHGGDTAEECKSLASGGNDDSKYHSRSVYERAGNKNLGNAEAALNLLTILPRGPNVTGGYGYNDIQMYLLYKRALEGPCQAVSQGLVADNTSANSATYSKVTLINKEGTPNEVYFQIPDKGKEVTIALWSPPTKAKCGDIPSLMGLMENGQASGLSATYSSWIKSSDPDDLVDAGGGGSVDDGESSSTCRVDGIGWIVCPIMNFLAGMADSAYYLLENSLLRVAPLTTTGTNTSLYESWKIMRNFANIAFTIAFLIIVFSQITSFGVSNYGIKRLLPKLIVSAILVNLSFYICAIAVDISNILGSQLKILLDNVASDVAITPSNALGSDGGTSGFIGWTTITGGTLIAVAATGGGMAVLPVLGLLLLAVLGAVLTVVVTLILRQVLIILLVVVSPLAFIALLLPNTEDYFKKWRSVFQTLLLLYPIISLVFGASALASAVIMGAAEAAPTTSEGIAELLNQGASGITQILLQLTGAAAAVLPLFIVPALMKLAGGVLNRFAGIVNDPSKGLIDSKRNSLKESRQIRKAEGIQRQGEFAAGAAGNRVLGAGDTRRRRIFGRVTAFGANNRQLTRKDDLARAGSILESSYLGTEDGQGTRNANKNAQSRLQNAQTDTETTRLTSAEGVQLQHETMLRDRRKKTVENEANTAAEDTLRGSAINEGLKQSEVRLHTAETLSQTAALAGVSHADEGAAQQAAIDKKAAEDHHAAGSAAYVNRASRTAAMVAEKERQAAENRETAAATVGPALTNAANAAKSAENIKQAADNNLAAGAQGSAASRLNLAQSQLDKKIADDAATTNTTNTLNSSAAGQRALGDLKDVENLKQMAENDSKAIGIARANEEFKVQTEASSEALATLQNEDKQIYEEIAAVGDAHPDLAARGISTATANAARASRREKKAVDSAISNAAYEGELAYAAQIRNEAEARRVGGPTIPAPLLDQAGGNIDPQTGRARAEDRAISIRDKASGVEVENAKSRIEDGDPVGTLTRARDALIAANAAGDIVEARAAARVLRNKGSAGNRALDEVIIDIERQNAITPGALNNDVFESLRAELAGGKDSNSARDRWATEGGTLASRQTEAGTISRLNEQELAGQQMHVLRQALTAGTLAANEDLVRRVLAQNDNGTIKLDTDKRMLLESALPIPPPPPPPPADPNMRASTI